MVPTVTVGARGKTPRVLPGLARSTEIHIYPQSLGVTIQDPYGPIAAPRPWTTLARSEMTLIAFTGSYKGAYSKRETELSKFDLKR